MKDDLIAMLDRVVHNELYPEEPWPMVETLRIAEACLAAIEAAGYRVVPVEPTEAMLRAGHLAMPVEYDFLRSPARQGEMFIQLRAQHKCVSAAGPWRAMLDAAALPLGGAVNISEGDNPASR